MARHILKSPANGALALLAAVAVGCSEPQADGLDPLVRVTVAPTVVDVGVGQGLAFSAFRVVESGDSTPSGPESLLWEATGGSISGDGFYTAGQVPGQFTVTATDEGTGLSGAAQVNVLNGPPAPLAAIELTPPTAAVQVGGTIQFAVTGRRTDGSTQAVSATFAATGGSVTQGGLYTAGGAQGTFRVVASASGFADTSTITVSPAGTFQPPDLESVSFDQAGDDAAVSALGVSFPASWHTADATGGRNGSRAMRIDVSGGSRFEPVGISFGARGRVFVRWYFRTQGVPGGNVKGFRFHNSGGNAGELYGGSPCWSFDTEAEAHCFDVGMSYTSATASCPALANGQWHSLEVDYNRNAGSNVEVRLWCDATAVVLPNGPATSPFGGPYPAVQFVGGDRQANSPTIIRTARSGASTINDFGIWETISQASGSAVVWIDDIAVSTQRIGP